MNMFLLKVKYKKVMIMTIIFFKNMFIKKLVLGDLKKQVSIKSLFGRKVSKSNIATNG